MIEIHKGARYACIYYNGTDATGASRVGVQRVDSTRKSVILKLSKLQESIVKRWKLGFVGISEEMS